MRQRGSLSARLLLSSESAWPWEAPGLGAKQPEFTYWLWPSPAEYSWGSYVISPNLNSSPMWWGKRAVLWGLSEDWKSEAFMTLPGIKLLVKKYPCVITTTVNAATNTSTSSSAGATVAAIIILTTPWSSSEEMPEVALWLSHFSQAPPVLKTAFPFLCPSKLHTEA